MNECFVVIASAGETMTETQLRFYKNLPKAEGRIREHQLDYLGILEKAVKIFEKNNLILLANGRYHAWCSQT